MRLNSLFAAVGAGSKSLQADNARQRNEQRAVEQMERQRRLEDVLNQQRAESQAAQMESRKLDDLLTQERINDLKQPKPQGPPPSRQTDRGIEEWDGAQWKPTGRKPYQAPVQPTARATVPTEGERRAAGMSRRLKSVSPELNSFDNRKTLDEIASRAGMLGNWASSAEGRRLRAAGKIWATAVLRPESGATITEEELDAYFEMYLPRPGDDDATLEFKRQQRKIAEESVSIDMAGRAAKPDTAPSGGPDHTQMSDEEFAKAYKAGMFKKTPGIPK